MTREQFDKLIEPAWREWQAGANCGISDVFWIALMPYLSAERVEVNPPLAIKEAVAVRRCRDD